MVIMINTSEVLVILLVALIVFGPSKLPMLARHLGLALAKINDLKALTASFIEQEAAKQQLKENLRRAEEAELQRGEGS